MFSKTGKYVAYDVHTHPQSEKGSGDLTSTADVNNVIGRYPSIILGYKTTIRYSNSAGSNSIVMGESEPQINYERRIVFYNRSGEIKIKGKKSMSFYRFKGIVKKLNR